MTNRMRLTKMTIGAIALACLIGYGIAYTISWWAGGISTALMIISIILGVT
jgi:hypothetical protein